MIDYTGTINNHSSYSLPQESYKSCALVVIEKGFSSSGGEDIPYTKIMSRGYNSSKKATVAECDTSNPRVVERGVFVQY